MTNSGVVLVMLPPSWTCESCLFKSDCHQSSVCFKAVCPCSSEACNATGAGGKEGLHNQDLGLKAVNGNVTNFQSAWSCYSQMGYFLGARSQLRRRPKYFHLHNSKLPPLAPLLPRTRASHHGTARHVCANTAQ